MVSQWVADHFSPSQVAPKPVAVLVPRRAIAEGLAKYVSELRGCAVGQGVGLGMAGTAFISPQSMIVFMTYGFFKGLCTDDPSFSKWSSVVLDEAHERKLEADQLMVKMAAACKARSDFKAVVMSATIDPSVYVDNLKANQVPNNIAAIAVPGVTFPVDTVWYERDPWDPTQPSALSDLALETIWVYLKETAGNVLVFVSTVGAVTQLVHIVSEMMKHDMECVVLPMYAALNKAERDEATDFSDLQKNPQNQGKRMICVATNMAEAGVTIPGSQLLISDICANISHALAKTA